MSPGWWLVICLGTVTLGLKGGGVLWHAFARRLPKLSAGMLAPAVLAGLVATQTLMDGRTLVLDGRAVGVLVGAALSWKGLPLLLCVAAAAATVALWRVAGLP